MSMKYIFVLMVVILSFPAFASPCKLTISAGPKDLATFIVKELNEMPEKAKGSDFVYKDGLYCHRDKQLFGRISFKDQTETPWVLRLTSEKMKDNTSMTTLLALRDDKKFGPQIDLSSQSKPCSLMKQKHVFSLIGLQDKVGHNFAVSLVCK